MRCFLFVLLLLICSTDLRAEEFIAKHGTYEVNGKKSEISNIKSFPSFDAEYQQWQDVVTIKSSAGTLILKKGLFFYGYSGRHKGLVVTARAYVEDGKLVQIVYEEFDELNNMKATVNYYKR